MKNISLRNMLILLSAVIIALLALGFVSTLLNQIIPITIALIAGLVLGRLSARVDVLAAIREALRRDRAEKPAEKAVQSAEKPAPDAEIQANADAIKARLEDKPDDAAPEAPPELTDFEIKTEEEILAEARKREAELASKKADYDPAAALAERRRRLLGEDADKG